MTPALASRFVRVKEVEPIGPDSVLTVEDPDDPGWKPVKLASPGRVEVGAEGYLRRLPAGRFPPRPGGWAFRPLPSDLEL